MTDKLLELRTEFVNRCSLLLLNGLVDDLHKNKILNWAEVETITEGSSMRSDKCRELVDMVRKKGDPSCNIFIQQLITRDPMFSQTLGLTEPSQLPLPTEKENKEPPIQRVNGITLCTENEFNNIKSKPEEIYPIYDKCKRKRLALVICNKKFGHCAERQGAEFDLSGMKELLEGLDYRVLWKTDLTAEEMRATMRTFAAENDHKEADSTFLVFMSHGEKDVICGTDSETTQCEQGQSKLTGVLHVDEIFNIFNNVKCSGLRDKPKVIIIQACRGNEKSKVLVSDCHSVDQTDELEHSASHSTQTDELEHDTIRMIQKERDFICFYSTTPDTLSWRNPKTGSLFIQRLIKIMNEDAHCSSIEDIFRKVQYSFKDDRQMPTQERKTLMKKFFLLPGY